MHADYKTEWESNTLFLIRLDPLLLFFALTECLKYTLE